VLEEGKAGGDEDQRCQGEASCAETVEGFV
jgi:hypothetical protein